MEDGPMPKSQDEREATLRKAVKDAEVELLLMQGGFLALGSKDMAARAERWAARMRDASNV